MTAKQYYLHVVNDTSIANNSIEVFKFLLDSLYNEACAYIEKHNIKTVRGAWKVHLKANKKWNKIMDYFEKDKLPIPFLKNSYIRAFWLDGNQSAVAEARRTSKNVQHFKA